MDGLGKQFLPSAAFPCNQDGGPGARHLFCYLPDPFNGRADSNDMIKCIFCRMALIQQLITYLMLLLLLLAKMLEHHKEPHVLLVVADGVYAHRDRVLIDFNQFCINFPVGPAALLKR